MTIFEYLREPHPWIDTGKYTYTQIALFFTGSLFWLICYGDTLVDIRRKKTLNIPLTAICLNFVWEVATCFFFVPDMGKLLVAAYWGWMCFDLFIFASTFRYGSKQIRIPQIRERLTFFLIAGIVISFSTQLTFVLAHDLPMAPLSGYLINLVMSVGFLHLLFIPGYEGNSMVTGWSKFLGTGLISVMFYLKYPQHYFLIAMYLSVAFFDVMYIVLLARKKRGHGSA